MSWTQLHDFCFFDSASCNLNLSFLKVLAIVTAIHELQHFLRVHLKEKSPTQPIPSLRPPEEESGDSWEVNNLKGRLGILSRRETMNIVSSLYLTIIVNGDEVESQMDDSNWIEYLLLGVSEGRNVFPLADIVVFRPIPDALLKGKVSHKCQEDSEIEVTSEPQDVLIKRVRPNDKIGRRNI